MKKNRRLHTELNAWLKAEATGNAAGAEAAFAAVVAALPRLGPAPGFAERVVWAAVPGAATARPAWLDRLARGSLAAALVLAAMVTGLLPAIARFRPDVPSLGEIAKAVAGGLSWIGRWSETGLEVWGVLGGIGEAMSVALGAPEARAALGASAVLGAIGFYTLHHLLTFERSTVR